MYTIKYLFIVGGYANTIRLEASLAATWTQYIEACDDPPNIAWLAVARHRSSAA
jgi:hypothetical protein